MATRPTYSHEADIVKSVASDTSYTSVTAVATLADLSTGANPVNGDGLALGKQYRVTGVLVVDGAQAGDVKVALSLPSGATFIGYVAALDSGATGSSGSLAAQYFDGTATTFGTAGSGTKTALLVEGLVTMGTTAGAVAWQFAQGTSSATATKVYASSWINYRRAN